MGNCTIHGKHSGKTCGYCGLGNRIKDLSVHQENTQLKQRIAELEESLRLSIAGQSVEKAYSEKLEAQVGELETANNSLANETLEYDADRRRGVALMEKKQNHIEQLQAKLDAVQWQPIETAPKGETLLLWWKPKGHNPYAEAIVIGQISGYNEHGGKWWNVQSGEYQSLSHITHWMPLPEPPALNGEDNDK